MTKDDYDIEVAKEYTTLQERIAELEKENAELNDKLDNLTKVAIVRLVNWQKLEKENAELKAKNEKLMQMLASSADCENCKHYDEDLEKEDKEPCKNCFYDNSFWELKED